MIQYAGIPLRYIRIHFPHRCIIFQFAGFNDNSFTEQIPELTQDPFAVYIKDSRKIIDGNRNSFQVPAIREPDDAFADTILGRSQLCNSQGVQQPVGNLGEPIA